MTGTAAKLYLVCMILHRFVLGEMGIPFWVIAAGSVALVWLYTHKSGIKTIVWTDTLQTFCLIAALVCIMVEVMRILDTDFSETIRLIYNHPYSRIFVFDDWVSTQNFFKQFISGIFIVIVMTGLDQDMMQKNLSCPTLKDARKNMYWYGFSFIPLNLLFLCLGILLLVIASQMDIVLPVQNDDILPMFATQGYLGPYVLVLFTIGTIAAAFSNSDSALTAMTTSFCVDILRTDKDPEQTVIRKRSRVHIAMSVILVLFYLSFLSSRQPEFGKYDLYPGLLYLRSTSGTLLLWTSYPKKCLRQMEPLYSDSCPPVVSLIRQSSRSLRI